MAKYRNDFKVEYRGEVTIIHFTAKVLDAITMENLYRNLLVLAKGLIIKKILLDFSEVDCFSSTALCNFVALNRFVESNKGKLVICSIHEDLMEPIRRMHLSKILTIEKILDDGLKAFDTNCS